MNKTLIDLATSLGWKVWVYKNTVNSPKNVYVLRSPLNVPFNEGKPITPQSSVKQSASPDAVASATFKVQYRHSEQEAWGDLPNTEDEIRAYSEWGGA